MATTTAKPKLKIFPGRGLTGKDIKNRLRNRTLQGQTFGEDSYMLDENMAKFTKMSRVEQIQAARENNSAMRDVQRKLDEANNANKKRLAEQEIERKVQEKLREMGREQFKSTSNVQ